MGIKILNLQMIAFSCFHLMGNRISCLPFHRPEPPVAGTIKLMKSDGNIKIYHRPVHVSDLMVEFPKHMVCRSDSFYIGQKVPALSESDQLQIGHSYFLLPNHFFQSVLSFVTIASFAAAIAATKSQSPPPVAAGDSKALFLKKAANCQPFDIQKAPSGCLRIRVSEEFLSQLLIDQKKKEEDCEMISKLCTTAQLRKEYKQLVGSRQWKPKLEPIREKSEKRKIGSFGRKRRKSSQSKGSQSQTLRSRSEQRVGVTELSRL